MNIPSSIQAGDTVKWRDQSAVDSFGAPITSADWTLRYYLRTNTASEGATITGAAYESGWQFTISQNVSSGFDAGAWYWQALATKGNDQITLGTGQVQVNRALVYSGTPSAFDGRSQLQKDLDQVQNAIRSLMAGGAVQEYRIGMRSLKRYDLAELLKLESQLKAEIVREKKAEMIANGLGNPHTLYVRFGGR